MLVAGVRQKEDEEKAHLARVAAEEAMKKQEEERRNITISPGDYQVLVHVIEARNLKPEDLGGTSDPVAYAKVCGTVGTVGAVGVVTASAAVVEEMRCSLTAACSDA